MLSFLSFSIQSFSQEKRKDKKRNKTEQVIAPTKQPPKEKTIADLVKTSKKVDGLFTIYQDTINGSLQMLITDKQLNQKYIYFSQVSDGTMDAGRIIRGSYRGSKVFKIEKYFDRLEFIVQNTSFYFDPNNPISKSKDANISIGNIASIKIEATNKKDGTYLIKADDLFLTETLQQIKRPSSPNQSPNDFKLGSLDKSKTKISYIKNYPNNTDVEVEYVYSSPSVLNTGSKALADPRNVSVKILHSLVMVPENDYEIRFDDPRVGFFMTEVDDKTYTRNPNYRDIIHRWHLVKKNPDDEISEPIEPITWWIENTTPLEWRETIKEAVLKWNVAFEKAGFKNAITVNVQPDDADWDAGDIRYNVLRWTSSPEPAFGGYGPRFYSPITGQILGADIMLEYSSVINKNIYDKVFGSESYEENNHLNDYDYDSHNNCIIAELMQENMMFGNIATQIYGGKETELERIQKEGLTATVMHEIGHTLGLYHNMKASQLFTPEQLADADFIKGKCLTASVMDYTTINVTRDRTKQGQFDDMAVGPYDIWAIQLGYKPFNSEAERQALLNESTKPEHIFGNDADDMRSPGKAIDPRVMIFDQSNDAIAYSIDRIELSNDLLKKAKANFTKPGESYNELRRVYSLLIGQQASSAEIISRYIGGVYVDRGMANQKGAEQPYTPVSLEDQKRAMKALETYVFSKNAFEAPHELYNFLARQRRGSNFSDSPEDPKIHSQVLSYQKNVLKHLLHYNTMQRITDSELYGNQYALSTFMTDLNNAIFKADITGNVNSFRQNLQLEYTNMLIEILIGKQNTSYTHSSKSMVLYNLYNIRSMATLTGNISSIAHKKHLRTLIDNVLKEIK